MEDSQIIELFWARSEQAISELAYKYGGICRRVAYHILGNPEDVEECVNDTWLGTWNTVPPNKPDPLVTYVCRITRNLALKRYRYNTAARRNCLYDIPLSELEECLPSAAGGRDPCTEENLTRMIEAFLDTQDKKSRILFVRRYWYAESLETLAEEYGMTQNHVSVKLSRVRGKLKAYLEKEGVIL